MKTNIMSAIKVANERKFLGLSPVVWSIVLSTSLSLTAFYFGMQGKYGINVFTNIFYAFVAVVLLLAFKASKEEKASLRLAFLPSLIIPIIILIVTGVTHQQ